MSRRYLAAMCLLVILAVVFGLAGTVAPPLAEEVKPSESSSSSSSSVAHFTNPPTYDSGWVDIGNKTGQYVSLKHNLNTTDVVVDIAGKQSLDPMSGTLAWSKTYGGTGNDYGYCVVETSDGGYAIAGYTLSFGWSDQAYLVKTDSAGTMLWNKTYGGASSDYASSLVQTSDGGYALAGSTYSYSVGGCDSWLVKTDSAGTMLWNKTYGGTGYDYGYCVVETSDGGYAVAGYTNSYGAGGYDFWLVKTDSAGTMLWNKTYGGTGRDEARSVVETGDGGYALAGFTGSYGAGGYDFWLVKTDSAGTMLWNKTYGGASSDVAYSVVQTSDGGYALAGYTDSYGVDTPGHFNMYLVQTYADGTMAWNRTYGGASEDYALSVVRTSDGGYALAGNTYPYGTYIGDACLVKTDSAGNLQWNKTYGGTGDDCAWSVVRTSDGGYAVAGYTYGAGSKDFWLAKVKPEMNSEHQRNFGGTGVNIGWSKTYGGANTDYAHSVVQTSDRGYAIAGETSSFGLARQVYLVKTDADGTMQWNKTYGGAEDDAGLCVIQTSDGGYAIVGYSVTPVSLEWQVYLVKTYADGTMAWSKKYGAGVYNECGYCVVERREGGYAIAGFTYSYGVGTPTYSNFYRVLTYADGTMQAQKGYGGQYNDYAHSVVQTSDGGYAVAGYTGLSPPSFDVWLDKTDASGTMLWNKTYGGANEDRAYSLVQTDDAGYALAGSTRSFGVGDSDAWLVKTDPWGTVQWNRTYRGTYDDWASSVVQTVDGGYALAGSAMGDFYLVKTDSAGTMQWSKTYGGEYDDAALSLVQTADGGYALAGSTASYGAGYDDFWLVKTDVEMGLARTELTYNTITVYRGKTDPYWNYLRVRMWLITEPKWIYGDINMDGIVDVKDLYIVSRNYGKPISLLSLTGIIGIAGIRTVKKRKQSKQPSYIS